MSSPASSPAAPPIGGIIPTVAIGLGLSTLFLLLLGFMAPWVRADLDLTRAQLGLIMSCFFLAASAGSVAAGRWADSAGARRTTSTGLALGAIAVAGGVQVSTPLSLALAAVAAGIGYAAVNAGTSVAIATGIPPRLRTLAVSVRFAGVCTASTVAGLASPYLARTVGWRPVLAAYCALVLLAIVPALTFLPSHRPRTAHGPSTRSGRSHVLLAVGVFVFIAGANPLLTWSVSFLVEGIHLPALSAGIASATSTGAGGLIMIAVSGWQLRSGRWSAASMVPGVGALCFGALLLLAWASHLPSTTLALIGVVAGVATNFLAVNLAIAAVIDQDPHAAGHATGIITTGQFLGGAVAPTAFGLIVDLAGGHYSLAWLVSGSLVLISAVIFWRWHSTGAA